MLSHSIYAALITQNSKNTETLLLEEQTGVGSAPLKVAINP